MNWMGNLQQLGRSLMMPTIALPVAALLIRLGTLPWQGGRLEQFGDILYFAGQSIFTYLPFLFAVGVALGLTESAGIAGMSALFSYFLFTQITQKFIGPDLQFGVTGGIVIGILAALCFHRLKNVQLPESIQFFGGARLVPLVMGLVSVIVSLLAVAVGPYVADALVFMGEGLLSMGGFGTFLYGVVHRLLVPSGLHHILNNVYWFQLGAFKRPDGSYVFGDLPRFFAGDPTAGIFMAGLYPIMMFALPAIALAIIQEAREDLKPKIKVTFLTAALACFLTGVTEPIEFAFLFVAPYLFVIHAILSGFAMWITYTLNIHHGFSYSAGAIDYIVNLHLSVNGLWLVPIGLVYGFVYYYLFRWAIRRFRIPTPGREEGSQLEEWAGDIPYRSPLILQALGGKNNIKTMEACITRLRITLENEKLLDISALKHLGAAGVIRLGGGNIQVVFGTYSELIREEIMKVSRKDLQQVPFHSPMQGRMIPLEEVPDPIFAQRIVGNGVAFIPEKGELVSPVAGKIIHIYPTKHALGIKTEEGLEVLLHIGIDTSQLQPKWFTAYVKEGDMVTAGQLLVRFNFEKIKKHSKSLATPMLITNPDMVKSWSFAPFKAVKKGQASVFSVILKDEALQAGGIKNG
ncbi:glucose PTS transporter subunit IIA [Paenibacillus aurantius]|uniref:Glucose PTS transporter subunit IIA n=1 Tax=Paenibacillus aurantius TaxID=2918900 RepID=A0AA96LK92_9BACL|nr:glucose PTS transporter subunit IIA [Paenibacillus aurantius]WNQ13625.1 glucose PTS transporter subunit IIA [Paenibacillus aurantius]